MERSEPSGISGTQRRRDQFDSSPPVPRHRERWIAELAKASATLAEVEMTRVALERQLARTRAVNTVHGWWLAELAAIPTASNFVDVKVWDVQQKPRTAPRLTRTSLVSCSGSSRTVVWSPLRTTAACSARNTRRQSTPPVQFPPNSESRWGSRRSPRSIGLPKGTRALR